MQHERGIEHLLDAAERLPDVRFVFLGGHETDLATWRTELSRRRVANCKLLGYHPHETVCEVQQASDAVVFTRLASGRPEITSPLKVFEYLVTGVPIIAASIPSLQRLPSQLDVTWYDAAQPETLALALKSRLAEGEWPIRSDANIAAGLSFTWEMRQRALLDFTGPIDARTTF
jgi:glycosyltransferase involved in cell wall biosynthesis